MEEVFYINGFVMRLKEQMDILDIKAADLAKETGISNSSLSLILRGERAPSTAMLIKFSDYFGVSVDYLIGRNVDSKLEEVIKQENIQNLVIDFLSLSSKDRKRVLDMILLLK
jgi:transcriptional regulator with XRE-family HTH domain